MNDDEPHRIEDNAPPGEQAFSQVKIVRKKKSRKTIIVSVGFDENLKEFELWDHLYDFETEKFEMDAIPDYKNRIQYYKLTADSSSIRNLSKWLKKKEFKFKLD